MSASREERGSARSARWGSARDEAAERVCERAGANTAINSTVGDVALAHKLVVCVGTGGVGKTTMSAAIALGAARRGRRAMVLTIDPARALARALGLAALSPGGERVALPFPGTLDAAMLDQKQAWDGFVARHAPTAEVEREILENPFYRELSTSFSGSTEYMAIEEVCRLIESDRYDLVVLDTPPAAHALDFLSAPERIDRILDRDVARWLTGPHLLARYALRHIVRAAGESAIRDIATFLVAIDALLDDAIARTRRARALLASGDAALVLVAGPRRLVLEETGALAERMRSLATPLAAVVLNRVHTLSCDPASAARALAALDDPAVSPAAAAWLRAIWDDTVARADDEHAVVSAFAASLPPDIAVSAVPEGPHDVHALADLEAVADQLWR